MIFSIAEYGMGSEVSTHGDVYTIPERVIEIVDPILLQENEEGQTSLRSHSVQECLISIFGIGVTCSSRSPSERTNMDDVTAQLHSIKNKLLQTPRWG
ncbi:hypothetical protein Patl1_06579 [Pistacia atlantica]|uniref:Uncharacterized protein n=1 Tax=Pistacia atlantica TaxID=434234 RepID=A0ACC1BT10_9ROSI|nr:hypothetical protein Patl1_06579 [Pistacia atlantica]